MESRTRTAALAYAALLFAGASGALADDLKSLEITAQFDQLEQDLQDSGVEPAQYLDQPGLVLPPESPGVESPRPLRRSARSEYVRLARVPNMLGDSLGSSAQLLVQTTPANGSFLVTFPMGAARSLKIAENNKALPMDRVYFIYNGFKNAIQGQNLPPLPPLPFQENIDRYTVGAEKTFLDGLGSIDVRMPFIGAFQFGDPSFPSAVRLESVGDLGLNLKGLLYGDDRLTVAAGLGITIPTAADAQIRGFDESLRIRNEACHLLPYLGFLLAPNDDWFFQGFIQADFAASGFKLQRNGQFDGPLVPEFTEQNLMYYDLLVGRWLYRNPCACCLTGIAALLELHYTTSIEDAQFAFSPPGDPPTTFSAVLGNPFNRIDVLNLSAGVHVQLTELSNLRVSAVVPLRDDPGDRQFDSEVLVSFNREF
jgi:hypothetical protein